MNTAHHIKKKFSRLPLSVKMLMVSIVIVLTITPLLIAGFLSQQASRNSLLEGKREELHLDAEAIASAIDNKIAVRKQEAQVR